MTSEKKSTTLRSILMSALALALLSTGCDSGDPLVVPETPTATEPAPATVDEVYARIAELELSDAEIDAYLYERALAEGGTIVLYEDSTSADLVEEQARAVARAFPGLDVGHVAMGTSDFIERVLAEHRSGRPQADVVRRSAAVLAQLHENDLLVTHHGVLAPADVLNWAVTETGVIDRIMPNALVWRTDRPERSAPSSWDDFLAPEHAGCVIVDSPTWVTGLIAFRGEDAASQWFERFLANGGLVATNASAQLRRLVADEIACVVHATVVGAEILKSKGAPIDWYLPEGSSAIVQQYSVMATTPRPHATALFIRWAVGLQGARLAAASGELSVHPEVELVSEALSAWQDPDSAEFRRTLMIGIEEADEFEPAARRLINRFLAPNIVSN